MFITSEAGLAWPTRSCAPTGSKATPADVVGWDDRLPWPGVARGRGDSSAPYPSANALPMRSRPLRDSSNFRRKANGRKVEAIGHCVHRGRVMWRW